MGWRVVLAQRTPPMRAAAKRRSQAELGCGVGLRREVYGALAGWLTAEARHAVGGEKGYDLDRRKNLVVGEFGNFKRKWKQTGLVVN